MITVHGSMSPKTRMLLGALLVVLPLLATARAADIPYPAALDAAAVTLPDVSDISKKGLVVGNGELNAIVYSSGNDIRLRVSKNDCWDMRINTEENPPLPTVDVAKQTFTGEQGKAPPSWEKYVHPTALPCTDISLAAPGGQTAWKSAKLDLAKAAATVVSDADTTTVRVLSQRNVILIESGRAITLNGVRDIVIDRDGKPISDWVSEATTGKRGGSPLPETKHSRQCRCQRHGHLRRRRTQGLQAGHRGGDLA